MKENNDHSPDAASGGKTEADKECLRRDALICAFLFMVGAVGFYYARQMPVTELYGAKWYTAPGILPQFLSLGLILSSLALAAKSLAAAGGVSGRDIDKTVAYLKSRHFRRLALAAGTLTVYLFALLGNMHYILATFIYLFGSMILFRTSNSWKSLLLMLAVSFTVAYGVGYGFADLARIPLP